ncbi:hypothetical protein PN462_09080 [Spirulina sp. CS-785/01]|uniref:hypothetical protein n=1 Tax=Spirulina sp. CS-785/01 TaxID=3021716 RepID=UPI00232B1339|nr:hypothetical protein [Spirulina sp. CS-785/01]MDB9313250.1 hypothetical protein [Spirulina sp. CS-785/01]
MVIKERHKDPYRTFFTVDEVLGEYMATLLDLQNNDTVLEPAAGEGHLIDAVYSILPQIDITAYELNPNYAAILRNKYGHYSQLKI